MQDYLMTALVILVAVLWAWALIDIFQAKFENRTTKVLWCIAILIFPILGPIVYFQIGKNSTVKKKRTFQPDFKNKVNTGF